MGRPTWSRLGGDLLFLCDLVAGFIVSLTIVGIPLGMQSITLAWFARWPFGRTIVPDEPARTRVLVSF